MECFNLSQSEYSLIISGLSMLQTRNEYLLCKSENCDFSQYILNETEEIALLIIKLRNKCCHE